VVVVLKDLAKEGIVAGYLLGKSLGGGGGGEVTEINTKLAGTWTSPHITGADIGTIYNIDLSTVFQNAEWFVPDIEQSVLIAMSANYSSGGTNGSYGISYELVYNDYFVYEGNVGYSGHNSSILGTEITSYPLSIKLLPNAISQANFQFKIKGAGQSVDTGGTYIDASTGFSFPIYTGYQPLSSGYYTITLNFYHANCVFNGG
jgi:hypothetical protein